VATSTKRRQPIVVASNINQGKLVDIKRGRWSTDSRVGEFQLDNAYYVDNPWDRGHLARRSSMAWGDSKEAAKRASDGTMKYTNATLQHENLNQVRRWANMCTPHDDGSYSLLTLVLLCTALSNIV
jgi:endonuclease G, mitochondrial